MSLLCTFPASLRLHHPLQWSDAFETGVFSRCMATNLQETRVQMHGKHRHTSYTCEDGFFHIMHASTYIHACPEENKV